MAGWLQSINYVIMVVFGGMGSLTGSIVAAVGLTILPELLRAFSAYPHARVFGGAGDHHGVPSAGIVRQLGVLAAEIRQHVVLSGTREDARQIGCVSIGI